LLDSLDGSFDGEVDLLDTLSDEGSDSTPWIPEAKGEGVQGVVLSRGTATSNYGQGDVPVVVIQDRASGGAVRITGYQKTLREEIEKFDPQPGDIFAAKYHGKKTAKSGTEFHHYQVAVRKSK